MENILSNKAIIAQFYKQVVGKRDTTLIYLLVREDYIQHSPAGKDGRAALIEMIAFLKTLPPSTETQSPVKMIIEEGDMVAGLLDIKFMGKRMLVIDLFRLQNGMLAEHWDAVQEVGDDFVLDKIVADDAEDVNASKAFVAARPGMNAKRIIGEGDVVVTQSAIAEDGKSFASYDIFKVVNGTIANHYSIKQAAPDVMMHDNGMI
ncbi:nuclear transport factor 2 family protein [Mucilaginibacter antarcticus]|uniref:SnoaL-like aldol condensation-catalyzing enzyme n=1 Tax=Mucilaginibacter antarcticus TaxID=1855725 RepID=A0ABW5XUC6_9SPHI